MTRLDLRTLCWDWLDDPAGGYFTEAVVNLRLNLAMRETQKRLISANKEYYSYCLKTDTVANQRAYALPSDFLQTIRVERLGAGSGSNRPTKKLTALTPNERDLYTSQSAPPDGYYFEKNNIMLVPTPDAAYEIHLEYSYRVPFMTADGDAPDVPEEYHEFIAVLATRDCLIKDGRPLDPITMKLKEYELLLKQVADQRNADGPRMITQAGSHNWGVD